MLNRTFSNKKGFGLITVLIVILLAAIAMASMFVATIYAKHKVRENYHYRKALLLLRSKMDNVKFYKQRYNAYPDLNMTTVNLDEFPDGTYLQAEIWPSKTVHTDIAVSNYTIYDKVVFKITWEEPYIWSNQELTKKRSVSLREDFYGRQNFN